MIRFDDGTSSYVLGPRGADDRAPLADREVRGVLARWLAVDPWRTQLRNFAALEVRVDARTDDALVERMCALLSARGLMLSRAERADRGAPSPRLDPMDATAEPLLAPREDASHWIHVVVVDEADRPLTGVGYRLALTDGRTREGRTDADGGAYIDEIPAGECRFSIVETGRFGPVRGKQIVHQGECISTLAARSGVPWRTIWDAAENEPLREAGRHPNVLLPGDELHVPEHEPDELALATDRRHRVVVPGMLTKVHIRLVADLEALPDEPWVIEHPGGRIEGTSNREGMLEASLPALLGRATLVLPNRRLRYTLRLGELDPVETRSGAHSRLRNLGLASSDHVDVRAHEHEHAQMLLAFQRGKSLAESGELDDATIGALRDEYGI